VLSTENQFFNLNYVFCLAAPFDPAAQGSCTTHQPSPSHAPDLLLFALS